MGTVSCIRSANGAAQTATKGRHSGPRPRCCALPSRGQRPLGLPSRRGSSFALVMALVVAGMSAVYISAQFVQTRYASSQSANYQAVALGALEAVLTRHESSIVKLAEIGDPEGFARMHDNYGEELVGDCRVRWKIEPAIIRQPAPISDKDSDGDGYADANVLPYPGGDTFRQFIFNPVPSNLPRYSDMNGDGTWTSTDDVELQKLHDEIWRVSKVAMPNDFVYIYRIAGEAQHLPGGDQWDDSLSNDRALSSVQAVRYVAITKQPVFRYVIFYAQEGPKGDLEFCHRTPMTVRGSVQCNGAIYMGGGLLANNWGSLAGSDPTLIGPDADGDPVRVNGVNGIFRLDKKAIFSHLNGFPMFGSPPAGLTSAITAVFDSSANAFTGEDGSNPAYRMPNTAGTDLAEFTWGGRLFNPNRIVSDAIVTNGGTRQINGTEIRGVELDPSLPANDSRQTEWRRDSMKQAPVGFAGFARTRVNGGGVLRLPELLGNRAFEAQAIRSADYDGDPATDEHELAKPLFIDPVTGDRTTAMPLLDGDIVEAAGRYIGFGLGARPGEPDTFYFRRRNEKAYAENGFAPPVVSGMAGPDDRHGYFYNGWDVVFRNGGAWQRVGVDDSFATSQVGLIMRERPQPDLSYYAEEVAGEDDFYYMPYAYGKWNRSPIWPLWEMDVVATRTSAGNGELDAGINSGFDRYIKDWGEWLHWDRDANRQRYVSGGRLKFSSAQFPGPDGRTNFDSEGRDSVNWYDDPDDSPPQDENQNGWYNRYTGQRHYPDYYRENWRFFHTRRPERDTTRSGLLVEYFANTTFRGTPVRRAVGDNIVSWSGTSGIPSDRISWRATGFIRADESGSYKFGSQSDDGVRVWIDGDLVVDDWRLQGMAGSPKEGIKAKLLQEDQWYPIVVEFFENTGGQGCKLSWWPPSATGWSLLPAANLAPPTDASFVRADLDSLQLRMDGVVNGHERQKSGIMIRALNESPMEVAQALPPPSGPITQDAASPVVVEAEAFTRAVNQGTYSGSIWGTVSDPTASQGLYMATADKGQNAGTNTNGPRLEYDIQFATPGAYTVHVRLQRGSGGGNSDTLRTGFTPPGGTMGWHTSQGIRVGVEDNFDWYSSWADAVSFDISVPAAGIGTLAFAMMEDGIRLDKFYVVQAGGVAPQDVGPDATAGGSGRSEAYVPPVFTEAATLGHVADGRDAYVALLHSPMRGVFMQYRGATASSVVQTQKTWFIGSVAGAPVDGTGETLVAYDTGETSVHALSLPAPRTVVVHPSLSAESQTGTPSVQDSGTTEDKGRRLQMVSPVKTKGFVNKGGGDSYEFVFWQGPIKRRVYREARKYYERWTRETWRFTLDVGRDAYDGVGILGGQDFIPVGDAPIASLSDRDRRIQLYWGPDNNTTFINEDMTGNNHWTIDRDWVEKTWESRRTFTNTDPLLHSAPYYYGQRAFSADWYTGGTTYGDSASVWWNFEDWDLRTIKLDSAGAQVYTIDEINTAMDTINYRSFNLGTNFDWHGSGGYLYFKSDGTEYTEYDNRGRRLSYKPYKIQMVPNATTGIPQPKAIFYNTWEEFLFDYVVSRSDLATAATYDADGDEQVDSGQVAAAETMLGINQRTSADWPWSTCGDSPLPTDPTIIDISYADLSSWPETADNQTDYIDPVTGLPRTRLPTDPVTFSVERERQIHSDINSYVTRFGKWFDEWVPQWLPYPAWSRLTPPLTGGFRPEQWYAGDWTAAAPGKGAARKVLPTMFSDRRQDAPWVDDLLEWAPGESFVQNGLDYVWLRIERVAGSRYRLGYYYGDLEQPAPSDFQYMKDESGNQIEVDLRGLGDRVLAGPCLQSGHQDRILGLSVSKLAVEFAPGTGTSPAAPADVIDHQDWELPDATGNTRDSRYLASQYQVFWGPYEITEDFFSWRDAANDNAPLAAEDWIYNAREFGSQSRWWDCGVEKEDFDLDGVPEVDALYPTDPEQRCQRELYAKQTLLTLNMKTVQNYMKQRNLGDATRDAMIGGYDDADNRLPAVGTGLDVNGDGRTDTLADYFNGLFYASRCNRYPWNPNIDPEEQTILRDAGRQDLMGENPWTWPLRMPNATPLDGLGQSDLLHTGADLLAIVDPVARAAAYAELRYGTPGGAGQDTQWPNGGYRTATDALIDLNTHPLSKINGDVQLVEATRDNGVTAAGFAPHYEVLQPYPIANAPAFRPTQFHHGVRIANAEGIDWGLPNSFSGEVLAAVPEFGSSKSIIVTPSQLLLQGDLNAITYTALVDGQAVPGKFTPLAVVGDTLTMLSNSWNDSHWQDQSLVMNPTSGAVIGGGSLYRPWSGAIPAATSTVYNTSIITHNQPTTRESVRDGEAAAISTVLFYLENWLWTKFDPVTNQVLPADMRFTGSLVVMDSRRCSEAYLIDLIKNYGRSPWGPMGWHVQQGFHEDRLHQDFATRADLVWGTSGFTSLSPVYREANQIFDFNEDLLTSAGTPPFTPFGVTSTGTGAWIKYRK